MSRAHGFTYKDGSWIRASSPTAENCQLGGRPLRVATLNVLFDSGKRHRPCSDRPTVLHPEKRYAKVLLDLQESDADVVALNEVTPFFLQMLQDHPWVRQQFALSAINGQDYFADRNWGNIILSRVPFFDLHTIPLVSNIERKCPSVAVVVHVAHAGRPIRLLVCAVHLTAFPLLARRRSQQLHALCASLRSEIDCDCSVILGDFNAFWNFESQSYPHEWHELSGAIAAGPTWDIERNTMLAKYNPIPCFVLAHMPECFWGCFSGLHGFRLDRAIVSTNSTAVYIDKESPVTMFADKPVGTAVDGAPSYLYPSDHFGFFTDLRFCDSCKEEEEVPSAACTAPLLP